MGSASDHLLYDIVGFPILALLLSDEAPAILPFNLVYDLHVVADHFVCTAMNLIISSTIPFEI
jgi:hypothetical protein